MKKITTENLLFVFGVILILAGSGSRSSPAGDTSNFLYTGFILIAGGLACLARKKQVIHVSILWLALEIISLLFILQFTMVSFEQGLWYMHPITYLFAPLYILFSWIFTLIKVNYGHKKYQ